LSREWPSAFLPVDCQIGATGMVDRTVRRMASGVCMTRRLNAGWMVAWRSTQRSRWSSLTATPTMGLFICMSRGACGPGRVAPIWNRPTGHRDFRQGFPSATRSCDRGILSPRSRAANQSAAPVLMQPSALGQCWSETGRSGQDYLVESRLLQTSDVTI
jgi:hypothetical protein